VSDERDTSSAGRGHDLGAVLRCKHGYAPDKQMSAMKTVIERAEVLSEG